MSASTGRMTLVLALATVALAVLGMGVGSTGWHWPWASSSDALSVSLVWDIRAPRTLGAFLVGALLGLAGAVAQGLFRNPLAEPYLLGSSSGAARLTARRQQTPMSPKLSTTRQNTSQSRGVGELVGWWAVMGQLSTCRCPAMGFRQSDTVVVAPCAPASLMLKTLLEPRS